MGRLIDSLPRQQRAWERLQRLRRLQHIPHALAFTGSEEATALAWAFAQSLLCDSEDKPCGTCGPCLRVEKQQSEAVLLIESDKGAIKLEAAHLMNDFLSLQRLTKARIILVPEAQNLNPQATNAMLKLVEEPPPETFFLFITKEMGQLLPTLRSRVQVIRLLPDEALGAAEPELIERVDAYLRGCFERRDDAVKALTDEVDSRESALAAALAMQYRLRDWSAGPIAGWPEAAPHQRVQIWRMAQQIEQDLHANVDRGLLFTNFYQQVPYALA